MCYVLQFRQATAGQNADHAPLRIKVAIEAFDLIRGARLRQPHVQSGKNSPLDGKQVGSENKIVQGDSSMFCNLGSMAMREQPVGAEILVHLDEMSFALRFFSRAAHAGLAIAYHPAR